MAIMDGGVRRFQVAGESGGIEQRAGEAMILNLGPYLR
jgi:hypothetical protein